MNYLDEEYIDPFEARVQFTDILDNLTASQKSVTEAAKFAIRHRKSYELLYEILRKSIKNQPVQSRINIFHVLDCICRYSIKIEFEEYIELIKNDLSSIIADITPENDSIGDSNVRHIRKVLKGWRDKNFFPENVLKTIYETLYKRELSIEEKCKPKRVKNEITKRMEEDRVKQKKRKESAWILTPEMDEFSIYWENTPQYSKSDCEEIIYENKIYYHGNYPDIREEDISKLLNPNEIEIKLRSKPITYNKGNFENELYHKNERNNNKNESQKEYKESYYYSNKNHNGHEGLHKRIRTEKERESYYNDYDDRFNSKDYNIIYNRNNDKDRNREFDKDNKNDKFSNNDIYNKYNEKYDKSEKLDAYTSYKLNKSKKKNRIFIWDLDETLILFKSLLDRSCNVIKPKDKYLGVEAAKKMMNWIYLISEKYFYYNDIEEIADPSNLDMDDIIPFDKDLKNYPFDKDNIKNEPENSKNLLKLLSYRYKAIKNKYDTRSFRNNIENIDKIDMVYDDIDNLSQKWLSFTLSLLDGVKLSGSYGKTTDCVLVSAGHLIPTLTKCVLFKLSDKFTSDKVWSSSKNGKDWCFKEIKRKYGDNYEYIVVGNGDEEDIASQNNGWTFFKITNKESLIEFNNLYIDS